jgi:acetyl esterase
MYKAFFTLLLLSLSLSAAPNHNPDQSVDFKKTSKDTLQLHFFFPEDYKKDDGKTRPAIVFFFGGGWSGGSPKQFYPFSRLLADKGMIAISAQYRTKKSHAVQPSECIKDGKSAIRWVRAHAKDYGIDPNMIAAGGGSAGGHVAASTATSTKLEEMDEDKSISSRPNLLVLCNPVVDNSEQGYGYDRVKDYWKDFSPLHNIDDQTPNSIFFLGSKDRLIPLSTGEAWDKKIKSMGKDSELHVWEGQAHGFFNYKANQENGGEIFQDLANKMVAFLAKNGYIK